VKVSETYANTCTLWCLIITDFYRAAWNASAD